MLATAEYPICASCDVEYVAEYEGPCREPGCTGRVSWKATADRLADQIRPAEKSLRWIANATPDEAEGVRPLDDLIDRIQDEAKVALERMAHS